jgi:hypothetical protein
MKSLPPRILIVPWMTLLLLGGFASMVMAMGKGVEAPKITKEQLLPMMENPDVILLDVRESESWKDSRSKIRGAVREDPEKDIQGWISKYSQEETLVFYCS